MNFFGTYAILFVSTTNPSFATKWNNKQPWGIPPVDADVCNLSYTRVYEIAYVFIQQGVPYNREMIKFMGVNV